MREAREEVLLISEALHEAGHDPVAKAQSNLTKARRVASLQKQITNIKSEDAELDEAKYELYHKDFSSAMQHAYKMAKKMYGITVDPKEIDDKVATGPRKPGTGKTNTYRLKGDKGVIQVQVYNRGGDRKLKYPSRDFELNMYKEEVELDEAKQKPYVSSDRDGFHVMNGSGKIAKSFKDKKLAQAYLKKNYDKLMKEELDKEDEPVVKKVVKMLKKASNAHAGQAKDLEKAVKEDITVTASTDGGITQRDLDFVQKELRKLGIRDAVVDQNEMDKNKIDVKTKMSSDKVKKAFDKSKMDVNYEHVELDEGKMSAAQIAKLKKAYEPMRGKKISMASGQKLSSIMDKVDDDKQALSQLVKADIPFVSQLAVTRLITKHGMKGAEIRKMRENLELDEKRHVDPADIDTSATADDIKAADKNIIMQMRKAVSLRGNKVEFLDKKKVQVSQKIAQAVIDKYNKQRKPMDKEKFQAKIAKSYKDLLSALKEGFASDAQRRAAFAQGYKAKGKKDKKESTLERMNKKIMEKKDG